MVFKIISHNLTIFWNFWGENNSLKSLLKGKKFEKKVKYLRERFNSEI